MSLYDLAGVLGAAMILTAFAGVQVKRLDPHRPVALTLNLVGATLVLVSLIEDWNLAAFLLEIAWIVFALYGFWRLVIAWRDGGRGPL